MANERPHYGPPEAFHAPRYTGIRTFARCPRVDGLGERRRRGRSACRSTRPPACARARASDPPPSATRASSSGPGTPPTRSTCSPRLSVIDGGDIGITPGNAERTAGQIDDGLRPVIDAGATPARARRRPLDRPRRAARARPGARAGRRRAARRARRHVGGLLRRALLPRHAVQARARGGPDRPASLAARRDARPAVRRVRPRRAALVGLRDRALRRAADVDAAPSTARGSASGSATARPTCRSTSTSSTRPSRRAPARPRSPACCPHEAVAFLRALAGVRFTGFDVVEVSPPYDGPGQVTALTGASIAYELLALAAVAAAAR